VSTVVGRIAPVLAFALVAGGFGLSLPSALVTCAHIPILAMGTLGGLAVGIAYALVY
jgi:hypothetical protein